MPEKNGDSLFDSAVERLESAARLVDIDAEALEQLRHPKTVVEVSVPLRRDDGSLRVFTGYRVRHDDTRGGSLRTNHWKAIADPYHAARAPVLLRKLPRR